MSVAPAGSEIHRSGPEQAPTFVSLSCSFSRSEHVRPIDIGVIGDLSGFRLQASDFRLRAQSSKLRAQSSELPDPATRPAAIHQSTMCALALTAKVGIHRCAG